MDDFLYRTTFSLKASLKRISIQSSLKIPYLVLIFMGILISGVSAALPNDDELVTLGSVSSELRYGLANGRMWNQIKTKQEKIYLLSGIQNGINFYLKEFNEKTKNKYEQEALAVIDSIYMSGFRMSDYMQQIDLFYADSSNLRIPIVDAYKYAILKMKGRSLQDLS